jgi:hypothetical protein
MTAPNDPTPRPAAFGYPTRTKVIIVAVLTVAISALALGYLTTNAGTGDDTVVSGTPGSGERDPSGVEELIPAPGSQILGQQEIGIDLAPGWTGELLLLPGNGVATPLPDRELERDPRNRITYRPGPGRTVERLRGDYCIVATVWDQVDGRERTQRVENWCFTAT